MSADDKPEPLVEEAPSVMEKDVKESEVNDKKDEKCDCGHDHADEGEKKDECGCGHDHEHTGEKKHKHKGKGKPDRKLKARGKGRKKKHHSEEEEEEEEREYSPPPPRWEDPVPVVLEDGRVDCWPQDPLKVVKTIVKEGKPDGKCPPRLANCIVHYVGTLPDGTKFDSSRDRDETFKFQVDGNRVIRGWEIGVATMKTGETADFVIAGDYAYGKKGKPPTIPPNQTLHFQIELFEWDKEPLTPEDKLAFCESQKALGNELVKKGNWEEAFEAYDKALSYIEDMYLGNQVLHKLKDEILVLLENNKALCCIKLGKLQEGLRACEYALQVDGANSKALFRRAIFLKQTGDFYRVQDDLRRALLGAPNDQAIKKELREVNELLKVQEKKQKKAYSGMFDKMKDMEDEELKEKEAREKKKAEEAEKEAKEKAEKEEKEKLEKEKADKEEKEKAIEKEKEGAAEEKKEDEGKKEGEEKVADVGMEKEKEINEEKKPE